MNKLYILIVSIAINSYAISNDAKDGQELFKEATCTSCHIKTNDFNEKTFDFKNHKATNMSDLNGWVSSCASSFNAGWFPEDEAKVLTYLKEEIYKY